MPELVVALDFDGGDQALALARRLKSRVNWFKVGLELFISAGPALVRHLRSLEGVRVFLDLKIYDIPNTAIRAALAAAQTGADMLTIHCQGGGRMCAGVVDALRSRFPRPPFVAGVTCLTSFESGEMPGVGKCLQEYALDLARDAAGWNLDGVVCSVGEAASIRTACPGLKCICPGIRHGGADTNDQRRTATPAEAVKAGADYLVVGRPITASPDPVGAAEFILSEIASVDQVPE